MRTAVIKFLAVFALFVTLFVLQKPVFLSVYFDTVGVTGLSDYLKVIFHGLPMDLSMAGYLSVIPGLLIITQLKSSASWIAVAEKSYFAFVSLLISLVFWLDIVLYGYWGFRLDMTPFFYFTTSPASAMASAEWWMIPGAVLALAIISALIYLLFSKLICTIRIMPVRGWKAPAVMTLLVTLIFFPIRGSLTVSTMNPSRAYFSDNQRMNHSAVNPMFSLMYSATHQSSYSDQYRYMDSGAASDIVRRLNEGAILPQEEPDSLVIAATDSLLKNPNPDIYIVILESFSASLMPSMGEAEVALGLDSIAEEGILFTNFYAGSFRTDRALPAILSALPPQPSESVLKYVNIVEKLPSLPSAIEQLGYNTAYYYGGDANFTNMMAYLVSLGIDRVVSDKDFSISQKTSKWGVHDHLLFEKVIQDVSEEDNGRPTLRIIQTSSSHEPFEVPYSNPKFADEPRLNAFAYTDSCLTSFVNTLRESPEWEHILIVALPDHWGVWPQNIDDPLVRHHIPLVIAGGALSDKAVGMKIETLGQQTDLAATLLALLSTGDKKEEFPFSKNLLHPYAPEFAFFSDPNLMGLITPDDTTVYDPIAERTLSHLGPEPRYSELQIKAYLQTLYEYLSGLQ